MNPNRNRSHDRKRMHDEPNRQSNMEPAEGSRETVDDSILNREGQDLGTASDRAMMTDRESEQRPRSDEPPSEHGASDRNSGKTGGITNRGLDREMSEQEQLPGRGRSQSEER
jgi:hypothetical protein